MSTAASTSEIQPQEPVSRAEHSEQQVDTEIAPMADPSPTESATAVAPDGMSEEAAPSQDVSAGSGQQPEEQAAPFVHATFVVPTENWKHLQMVPLATTAAEIKHSLCSNWNIAESALSVKYNKLEIQDSQSLASCGIEVRV